ncbi:MAG: S41 family peptidase [Clostridia bacterium]|nr:S41 family peptidase [Clostridia bacterium]
MFRKKHLVITAAITAAVAWTLSAIVFFVANIFFNNGDVLVRARKLIAENYVDPLTDEQIARMNDMAISAMVYSLGDPYSNYLNADALASYQEDKKEIYKGIGVSVNFNSEKEEMTVIAPYDNSPAQKAGILPGDIVKKVGDMAVTRDTYEAILEYIKAGEDDEIDFVIQRGEEDLAFTVRREEIRRQSVTHKMYDGGIGYIRVSEFIHNTKEDFQAAIDDLQSQNMQALIIDLRNNPGGYADTVIDMTDSLLPEGVIAYLEDNQGRRQYFNSDENALEVPMAVLINQGTASASELLAGSLQAHGLATIIGEKSFGKAVGQSVYQLSPNTAIYLTSARYFTPKGECIDGVGIMPDIQVALSEDLMGKISLLSPEEDPQLAKALEVLGEEIAR